MLWIPVAFVCLMSGECVFHQTYAERDLITCEAVNKKARVKLQEDKDVRAYDTTCIEVLLKGEVSASK